MTKAEALLNFQAFKALAPEVLNRLVQHCRWEKISDGQVLVKQGERLGVLFGILSGSLRAVQLGPDNNLLFDTRLSQGQLVGWVSVFDQSPMSASIIAQGDAELVLIPSVEVKRLVLETPTLNEAIFTHLCDLIRRLESERMLLSLPNAFHRVYFHLYRLFLLDEGATGKFVLPNQNEIARYVNTSRETVSRALQSLIKQGILVKEGHIISVTRRDQLKRVAEHGLIEQFG